MLKLFRMKSEKIVAVERRACPTCAMIGAAAAGRLAHSRIHAFHRLGHGNVGCANFRNEIFMVHGVKLGKNKVFLSNFVGKLNFDLVLFYFQ